jgi:prolyl-tRNA synthetase
MSAKQRVKQSGVEPARDQDFPAWYQAVVQAAELADMSHVRGCMVIRPWGYGLWELIQQRLDREIKLLGHENVYFPVFIPLSYFEKEAAHVAGFAKEMAVVTHHRLVAKDGHLEPAGRLEEPLIVRPTSETIIGESLAKWIESYRDLPMLLNQWANVVRWEMRPRVFLRTTEFLWQEGHTAHATSDEAMRETTTIHRMYEQFAREYLALAVVPGEKSPSERFPGAERTFTIEAMMQDGKALQVGTSHFLGQNFARAAGIDFVTSAGTQEFVHTTSWGVSTRVIGAVIMTHGDDDGLRVPPRIAPHHVVLIPRTTDDDVEALARRWSTALEEARLDDGQSLRATVDRSQARPVDKKWKWIRRGVPLIIEVGAREVSSERASLLPRHRLQEPVEVDTAELSSTAARLLSEIQATYLADAMATMEASTRVAANRDELAAAFSEAGWRSPFVRAWWCGRPECEESFKPWSATIRCIPTEQRAGGGICAGCGEPASIDIVVGKSY